MFNFEEQGGEAKAVGWISMSDLFMLCSIVMLAVAVCFALSLKKSDLLLTSVKGEYAQYRDVNAHAIEELKAQAAQLSTEAGGFKTQAAGLDQQLSALKTQLADSDKQLAFFKNESARFKAQSESLASQLGIQTTKLNGLQSDFDKFRNINTLSMGELKAEVARLIKEADDYKASVATLRAQQSALEGKRAESDKQAAALKTDRDKFKAESERLAAELDKQKSNFEGELAKANGDLAKLTGDLTRASGELTRVNGALAKANSELTRINGDMAKANGEMLRVNGEKDQLFADLNAQKAAYAMLQKEESDLDKKLSITDADKKTLEAKLASLQGTIVGLTDEIGELKPQLTKLQVDLKGARLRIIDLEKAVFEKINRAKLVITIAAQDVPKGFTLELFVTDPKANDCGPFSSVIFNDGDEIGVLQQSVDFKSGAEGSQKAVFYSLRPVTARNEPGQRYTVKAMIRDNGNNENAQLPHNVLVNCNIDLPNISGPEAHKVAKLEITSPGYIKKARRNGQLTSSTPYKNMWPWEPVYHFERTVCDFQIDGDSITSLRTFDNLTAVPAGTYQGPASTVRDSQEQKIDSIRNRGNN